MLRTFCITCCMLLLAACSDDKKAAEQLLTNNLAIPKDVEFRRMKSYPAGVVCGEYSAYSSHLLPKDDFKPFLTVRGKLYRSPKEIELAIYCSKKPAEALLEWTGIGPFTADNESLEKIAADFAALTTALDRYYQDNSAYPKVAQGLEGLVTPKPRAGWPLRNFPEGGYLAEIPRDPWGKEYLYDEEQWARVKGKYEILTLGADGKPGGSGENADVSSDIFPYLDHMAHVLGQR